MRERLEDSALVAPGLLLLLLVFFVPLGQMLILSVEPSAQTAAGFTLDHFSRFLSDSYYLGIAWRTLRLSLLITLLCMAIGFPLAYIMAKAGPRVRFWLIIVTILPLMTSVVVRTFGWMVMLSRSGFVTKAIVGLGLAPPNYSVIYTESAIVVGMVQVLLPFMALSILGVLLRMDRRLEEAGRTMGCGFWSMLFHIVLPISLPGVVSGSLLVLTLSISSFITPSLLGGARLPVLAASIYDTATKTLDWSFAAAQSTILLIAVLVILLPYVALTRGARG